MKIVAFLLVFSCPFLVHSQTPKLDAFKAINELMDNWHIAAAEADFEGYFGAMHEEIRYLGTDKTERWSKEEFMNYSRDPFASKRTWDFKPSGRKLSFSQDLKYAWFDEILDTWMGTCRGSGVVMNTEDGWKIMQYNLAILVDNLHVADYIDLVKKKQEENE